MTKQKIVPCLWFDKNAEEAMNFYVGLFPNSKLHSIQRYPDEVPEEFMKGMEGKVLTGIFELMGFRFMALDGGPAFKLNPSISFFVNFDPSQDPKARENIDLFWEKLSDGGKVLMPLQKYPFSERYGWVQDRFGVSWQLIYTNPEGEERPLIIPSLLFVGDVYNKADEAGSFYVSVFKDSKKGGVMRYGKDQAPEQEDAVMFSEFKLEGQWFTAMDSAREHDFKFNEAVSFLVNCKDQAEVDELWSKLSAVPASEQCGWLKDKYGVSW
jgi:predicted 3-demethylubiquinone-9 3-methyltransferase (glyoxalase superfamily)